MIVSFIEARLQEGRAIFIDLVTVRIFSWNRTYQFFGHSSQNPQKLGFLQIPVLIEIEAFLNQKQNMCENEREKKETWVVVDINQVQ